MIVFAMLLEVALITSEFLSTLAAVFPNNTIFFKGKMALFVFESTVDLNSHSIVFFTYEEAHFNRLFKNDKL